jgi:pimeloyl-ACP methyl ester carboxylesterase
MRAAILLLLFLNLAIAAPNRFANKLTSCRVPGVAEDVLCGTYEVYENRAAKEGRKISLNIVVLPAKSADVAPDPLVFLAGGGVAPATGYGSYFFGAFADLRQHRDIVLIDQRGTGKSNPLNCDVHTEPSDADFRDEARFLQAVRNCRKQLESKADLHYYTSPFAMDDLDEVRNWLGYARLNIYGVSYGTQAGMVYLRQHPDRVRALVLQGVLPFDSSAWLDMPRSTQQALDYVFAACARQQGCHNAFPNLAQEFKTLLQRLAANSVKITVNKPDSKEKVEVPIDAEILRTFVFRVLYSADRIHDLPFLIHSAYTGDYLPMAGILAEKDDSPIQIPKGIYYTIVCSEEMQFNPAQLSVEASASFMGEFRVRRDIQACGEWIRGWLPKDFFTPVRSNVSALVLNGTLDHVAPPRYGEKVTRSFSNARQIVLPVRGHNDTDPCVAKVITDFITAGSSEKLDTSCLAKTTDLTFALRADELTKD